MTLKYKYLPHKFSVIQYTSLALMLIYCSNKFYFPIQTATLSNKLN